MRCLEILPSKEGLATQLPLPVIQGWINEDQDRLEETR